MLISCTVIIMVRHMDIIGLSYSTLLSLIIDWRDKKLIRGAWLHFQLHGDLSHDPTAHSLIS